MPSHSVKQAKVMSAIAHGWHPSGKAADIPVKVAKEFHAADKGKKYGKGHDKGKKSYDRSGHHPGNPGFPSGGKRPYREYNGGAHAKQARGHSIGNADTFVKHTPNQSFAAEQKEHGGNIAKGSSMGRHHGKQVAFTGPHDRGSKLIEKDNDSAGHHPHNIKHPNLHGDGVDVAAHHRGGTTGSVAHSFKPPAANMAHGYGHGVGQRKGPHRLSGHKGAHMIGCRTK